MNKVTKLIIALLFVAAITVGVVMLAHHKKAASPGTSTSTTTSQSQSSTNDTTNADATITYDGTTFEPASVTVKVGQSIKIVNQSNTSMSFNSNPHPTHTDEPELNAGEVDSGTSKSITVTKVGNWGYHNHLDPSQAGRIIVVAH